MHLKDSYFSKQKKFLESLGFEADTKFIDFTFHNKVQNLNEESTFETQEESNLAQSMVLEKKEGTNNVKFKPRIS
jgi:hypothetical protein